MMRIKDEERLKQYIINVISIIESREGECIVNFLDEVWTRLLVE